jgi:NAD(P)H dehydrogenase (quinone)
MTPDDLEEQITSGAIKVPSNIEANYAASMLEWAHQTYDGRMDFAAVATTTVEDLLGRKPLTLRDWVAGNWKAVLGAGAKETGTARANTSR